jgi:DNA-binding phage protein
MVNPAAFAIHHRVRKLRRLASIEPRISAIIGLLPLCYAKARLDASASAPARDHDHIACRQLQGVVAKVIRAMGVKEFAAKIGMASPNLLRTLNSRHNPTQDTLNRLLKPFRLKLSLAPISDRPKRRNAA